jgi:hypothetical protein
MANFVIDADGHIMEDHKDIFAHIKGSFSEMNWHSTGHVRRRRLAARLAQGQARRPDAERGYASRTERRDCGGASDFRVGIGMIQLPACASASLIQRLAVPCFTTKPRLKGVACSPRKIPRLRRTAPRQGTWLLAGLLPSVTNNRTPLYGSPVFHEIYDEAQRLDVPLTIHGGVSQNLGLDRVASFLEAHMLEHPVGLFLQITNMMFQGVFQEFPKLHVAYLEAGAGSRRS